VPDGLVGAAWASAQPSALVRLSTAWTLTKAALYRTGNRHYEIDLADCFSSDDENMNLVLGLQV
jgi:hypothetical protein